MQQKPFMIVGGVAVFVLSLMIIGAVGILIKMPNRPSNHPFSVTMQVPPMVTDAVPAAQPAKKEAQPAVKKEVVPLKVELPPKEVAAPPKAKPLVKSDPLAALRALGSAEDARQESMRLADQAEHKAAMRLKSLTDRPIMRNPIPPPPPK